MKKILLSVLAGLMSVFGIAQTATNFNCNDCSGVNHNLFNECDSGQVIVMCWVMPCSSCMGGALACQSACQSFTNSNPGQVMFYCVDDYANTSCATLSSWCSTNGMSTATKFSNSTISMSNYGAAGMPKVVVIGGANRTVYYNQNNAAITQSGIQAAISTALAAIPTGVKENENGVFASANIYPNPSNTSSSLSFKLSKNSKISIEVQNLLGQKVSMVFNGNLQKGENTLNVNTSDLAAGNYFINFSDGETSKKMKFIVIR